VDKASGFLRIASSSSGQAQLNYVVPGLLYRMEMLLHGQDDARETWAEPVRRMMGWKYQVDYDCDIYNEIKDGGGNDDIARYTWEESGDDGLAIETSSGLWRMKVEIAVPQNLMFAGSTPYWTQLFYQHAAQDTATTDFLYLTTLRQLGQGMVRAVALDQSQCSTVPPRPTKYNYFRGVRPSIGVLPGTRTWRDCDLSFTVPGIKDGLDLSQGAMESDGGEPMEKFFRLTARTQTGEEIDCNSPVPR